MIWSVQLRGEHDDLVALHRSLSTGALTVTRVEDEYLLHSEDFANLARPIDVHRRATEIITILNGAARLTQEGRGQLRAGNVYRTKGDGQREKTVFSDPIEVYIRGYAPSIAVTRDDGGIDVSQPEDLVRDFAPLALRHSSVAKVFAIAANADTNWVDLYRIFEIVAHEVGGTTAIAARGWATKNAMDRFTHTANSPGALGLKARHGTERTQPPARPMSLSEADDMINHIVFAWLRSLK